jgi:elongator complex protein 3
LQADYDPYRQVSARLAQLKQIGHDLDKVELIVMGGTITARPLDYQQWFVKRCLDAMSDFGGDVAAHKYLEESQAANETAAIRNIAMTFETRPDWCKTRHIDRMLDMGVTKVELGVQSTYDFILKRIERGHTVADSVEANRALRDSGIKAGFHMMPGLPGSSPERDLRMFERLFNDARFCPDYLKIYPTLVTEGTRLYDWWKRGEYTPLSSEDAALLQEARVQRRVQRARPQHLERHALGKVAAGALGQIHLAHAAAAERRHQPPALDLVAGGEARRFALASDARFRCSGWRVSRVTRCDR